MPGIAEIPNVLIVEDEDLIRDAYALRLAHEGYTVSQARNGREALARARQDLPHLILLDVILPDFSGFEVLKALRADRRFAAVPVVLFTNLGQHMDKHEAARMGATDYLVKSEVTPAEVVNRVKKLLAEGGGVRPIANFDLYVDTERGDAAALASLLGYPRNYRCTQCGGAMVLLLSGDFSDPWTRNFRARLRCPQCQQGPEARAQA